MVRRITPLLLATAILALGACTTKEGTYPSLVKRPAERITATWPPAPPPPPPAPVPLDDTTVSRLDGLLAQVTAADSRFAKKIARARSVVTAARKAPMGTEAWSVASVAIAELESARAEAMVAMVQLDSLYADARTEGRDVTGIETTRQQALGIIAAQDGVLDSLKGALER